MYNELDYKKVIAILKQVAEEVNGLNNGYCRVYVESFEDQRSLIPFDAIRNLSDVENFSKPSKFSMVYSCVTLGEFDALFEFRMGENLCQTSRYVAIPNSPTPLTSSNRKVFSELLPFEQFNTSWRIGLADFIKKVEIIVTKNLKQVEPN